MAESRLLVLALVPLMMLLVALGILVGKSQLSGHAADGVLVTIKNVKTGKYLSVSQGPPAKASPHAAHLQ